MYAYVQDVPIDESIYARIKERLGHEPLEGLLCHIVSKSAGGLRYVDVWESFEACERAFEQRIHPAVYGVFSEIGFVPQGEPEKKQLEVVDFVVRAQRAAVNGR